jgi:hypothetical protein
MHVMAGLLPLCQAKVDKGFSLIAMWSHQEVLLVLNGSLVHFGEVLEYKKIRVTSSRRLLIRV